MALNPNIARWIVASMCNYFISQTNAKIMQTGFPNGTPPKPLPIYLEGQPQTNGDKSAWAELRIDGPFCQDLPGNVQKYAITVSILILVAMNTQDMYQIYQYCGDFANLFTDSIPIMKFGDGPDDDPAQMIDCMVLESTGKEHVAINHYGQYDASIQMLQSTVDGMFYMTVTN
jgi:hypothetical protein